MFAFQYEDVTPDIVIVGKALGGGIYPVSAVVATDEVMGVFGPGQHGSTFGGNPLGAAVACAALDVLVDENLTGNSYELGLYLIERIRALESPQIAEVRGKGLLVGIELNEEAGGARRYCEALMKLGVLAKETHENVIRFAPPLTISREQVDWALERLSTALVG